ncbi:MAG: tetratricopeptide repeat protein [Eubacteriaceae bacterium]|nr:tetratricopeptide repeat protein [Eubacteriaceae bacterium]
MSDLQSEGGASSSEAHTSMESQLFGAPVTVEDSEEVKRLIGLVGAEPFSYSLRISLGDALCSQLRYLEAINQYSIAIGLDAKNITGYYKRAQRYLCVHQFHKSLADYCVCAMALPKRFDFNYKIGLLWYFLEQYEKAIEYFDAAESYSQNGEMRIAVVYWRHFARMRCGKSEGNDAQRSLFSLQPGMNAGHHESYLTAIEFFREEYTYAEVAEILKEQKSDIDYVTILYAVYRVLCLSKDDERAMMILKELLKRNFHWPSFSYVAAFNDYRKSPYGMAESYTEYAARSAILD